MKHTKLFAFLLAISLVCTLALTACTNDGGDTSDTSSKPSDNLSNPYQDSDGYYVGSTSGKTYEGKTITFLVCSVNPTWESEIVPNTYEDGESRVLPQIINDDIKKRNELLEEKLGITVAEQGVYEKSRPNGDMLNYIRNGNMVSTDEYQVVLPCLYDGATLALDNQLYNLRALDGFQIDAPWWNQEFNDSMTYGGQLYFTIGDIGLGNKNSTASLYFNLDLWNKLGLSEKYNGTPYDIVRDGKWTVDVVFEAGREFSRDVNSDNNIDYKDEFGWGGQLDDMWSIFFASGEKIASTDADGYPSLTMYNERSARLMEKLQEFVQDKKYYISANNYFGIVQWPSVLVQKGFTDGRCLFYNGALSTVLELGDMEEHFGIVPLPKADEIQEKYYSLVNPWTSNCFAIPTCVRGDDLQMTIDALNVLGADSKNTLAKDYQEIVLSYMKTRDEDSIDMINNYILPGRACDVGMVYKWGNLDTLLHDMASQPVGTFNSNYSARESSALQALTEAIDFYKENEK